MFSIYIKAPRENKTNSICIYDDIDLSPEYRLIDPELDIEDSAAGSLTFEMPLENVGYSNITPYSQDMDVFVYKYGYSNDYGLDDTDDIYWAGRVSSVNKGIENHKIVYCEGVLSFLCDTIQTPRKYTTGVPGHTLTTYITDILARHNSKVPSNRRIYLGLINVSYENTDWFTNYESTMDVIKDIADTTGGHLRIRRTIRQGASNWVLDVLNDDIYIPGYDAESNKWRYNWIPNETQSIEYGVNLTELDISQDIADIATVIYPLGKRKDKSTIKGLDEYYTITRPGTGVLPADVSYETDSQGKNPCLKSSLASSMGRYEKSVQYDDVTKSSELIKLGIAALTRYNNIFYEVSASAIDFSYRDRSLKPIEVHDVIQVTAMPHGEDTPMKVSKAVIPLDNPENGTFTIGNPISKTFTELTTKNSKNILSGLRYLNISPYEPEPPEPDPEPEVE